ncbi:MAG: T9SS type A sorting domain-containing protein [Bacteroidota bacterium]
MNKLYKLLRHFRYPAALLLMVPLLIPFGVRAQTSATIGGTFTTNLGSGGLSTNQNQGGQEWLYLSSEIGAGGTQTRIDTVSFPLGDLNTFPTTAYTYTNVQLYAKNTSATTLANNTPNDNLATYTLVFSGNVDVAEGMDVNGYVKIPLTTPFTYNGTGLQFFYTRGAQAAAPVILARGNSAVTDRARKTFSSSYQVDFTPLVSYAFLPIVKLSFGPATAQVPAISISPAGLRSGFGASSTVSTAGAYYGAGVTYQWQSVADAGSTPSAGAYSNIAQTASSFTASPTVSTWYRLGMTVGGITNYSAGAKLTLNPDGAAPTAVDGNRCGTGSVALTATAAGSGTLRWVANTTPIVGKILSTGATFNTPSLTTSTTYKVFEESHGTLTTVGNDASTACAASNGNYYATYFAGANWGYKFNVTNPNGVIFNSINLIPGGAVGGSFIIEVASSTGAVIADITNTTSVAAGNINAAPINVFLPQGTGYNVYLLTVAPGGFRTCDSPLGYPFTNAAGVTVTGSSNTGWDPGVPGFYGLNFSPVTTLSGAATATATITSPPSMTITPGGATTYCEAQGNSVSLTATAGFDSYAWSPSTGLSATTGATVTANPSTTTTYTVVGHVDATGCNSPQTVTVTVTPRIDVTASSSVSGPVCSGTPITLTSSAFNTAKTIVGGAQTGSSNIYLYAPFQTVHTQFMYSAAELQALGFSASTPNVLSSLGLFVTSKGTTLPYDALTVKVRTTTATAFTAYLTTGFTTVYNAGYTTALGWNTIPFSSPFVWDGTTSLVFDLCFNNTVADVGGDNIATASFSSAARALLPYNSTTGFYYTGCAQTTNVAATASRPRVQIGGGPVTYSWSPTADITTGTPASSAITVTPTAGGAQTYTVTASAGGCTYSNTVNITVQDPPAAATIAFATPAITCTNDSVVINATGTTGQLQWQLALDAGSTPADGDYSDIGGATSSKLKIASISASTWYRVKAACPSSSLFAASNALKAVQADNPTVSASDLTRCGTGTIPFTATGTGTIRWTDNAVGGHVLATGGSFTTPTIASTTQYGVFSGSNEQSGQVGKPRGSSDGYFLNGTYGLQFDVLKPEGMLLKSVDVIAVGAAGSTYQIRILKSNGTTFADVTGVTTAAGGVFQTLTLDVFIPTGTGYRIIAPQYAGGFGYYRTLGTTAGVDAFPFTLKGVVKITNGIQNNTPVSAAPTLLPTYYMMFYNWNVTYGCYSAVQPVTATVTNNPGNSLSVSVNKTVMCAGSPTTATISSTGYTNFTWAPTTGVTYTPGSTTATLNPSSTTTYTFTADDGNPDPIARCAKVVTIPLIVNSVPTLTLVSSSTPCTNNDNSIVASGSSSASLKIGTGTASGSAPFFATNTNIRSQFLYTKAEMNAQGFVNSTAINALALKVGTKSSTAPFTNFAIKILNSSADSLSAATGLLATAGSTIVYTGTVTTVLGVNKINFTTPFQWNGTSNILIDMCFSTTAVAGGNNDFVEATTLTPANAVYSTTGCGAGAVAATATNNRPNITLYGGAVNYNWTSANPATSPLALLSATNTGTVTFHPINPGTYTYVVTATDGANCGATKNVTLVAEAPGRWVGGTSTDFTDASNWNCGLVPTSTDAIVITANVRNVPAVSSATTAKSLTLAQFSKLNLEFPGTLTLTGDFTNNGGTISSAPGTKISMAGTSAQSISGSGTSTFYNFEVTNSTGVTNQSGSTVKVTNTFSLPSGGKYTNSGTTTLVSNAAGTARLGKLTSTGQYSGRLTAERNIPQSLMPITAGTNVMVGSPVTGQTLSNFQAPSNMFFGFPGAEDNPNVLPGATSVWFYNPLDAGENSGWVKPSSINDAMNPGTGARVYFSGQFVRSGGTYALSGTLPSSLTYPIDLQYCASGCAVGYTTNGWNLVANPVPSEISWKSSSWGGRSNVGSSIYIWQQGNHRYSTYTYDPTDNSSEAAVNGGTSTIASGQAFFVNAMSAGTLTASEDVKVEGTTPYPGLQRMAGSYNLAITGASSQYNSEAILNFRSSGATSAFDRSLDAPLLSGTGVNVGTITSDAKTLVINRTSLPEADTEIPMFFTSHTTGAHTLTFKGVDEMMADGFRVYLRDTYSHNLKDLTLENAYSFMVTSDAASEGKDRFQIIVSPYEVLGTKGNVNASSFMVSPNPTSSNDAELTMLGFKAETATVTVTDVVGKVVATKVFNLTSGSLKEKLGIDLKNGMYTISTIAGGKKMVQKVVIN